MNELTNQLKVYSTINQKIMIISSKFQKTKKKFKNKRSKLKQLNCIMKKRWPNSKLV